MSAFQPLHTAVSIRRHRRRGAGEGGGEMVGGGGWRHLDAR